MTMGYQPSRPHAQVPWTARRGTGSARRWSSPIARRCRAPSSTMWRISTRAVGGRGVPWWSRPVPGGHGLVWLGCSLSTRSSTLFVSCLILSFSVKFHGRPGPLPGRKTPHSHAMTLLSCGCPQLPALRGHGALFVPAAALSEAGAWPLLPSRPVICIALPIP